MDVKKLFKEKWKDGLTLILIGLLLAVAVWIVFGEKTEKTEQVVTNTSVGKSSDEEVKLAELLSQIRGVGTVEVMIHGNEEGEKSVVIVCEGANNIQVHMDVREAAATALGTTQQAIKIYLKKD